MYIIPKEFVAQSKGDEQVKLFFLPVYSPHPNPVELLWAWVKRRVGQQVFKTQSELKDLLTEAIDQLRKAPQVVQKFFDQEDCKSIASELGWRGSVHGALTTRASTPARPGAVEFY